MNGIAMYRKLIQTAAFASLTYAFAAHAHDAWFAPDPTSTNARLIVKYGDNWKPEPYAITKVKRINAHSIKGEITSLTATTVREEAVVDVPDETAMITLLFDNGFYSRVGSAKSVNLPMNENPGATAGVHPIKLHKTLLRWIPVVNKPVGHALEIVPLDANVGVGKAGKYRVMLNNQSAADVKVGTSEFDLFTITDSNGVFEYKPKAVGRQTLWVGHRSPVKDDPRFTELSLAATLIFELGAR
jgi:uncharacterized GH25 family protein